MAQGGSPWADVRASGAAGSRRAPRLSGFPAGLCVPRGGGSGGNGCWSPPSCCPGLVGAVLQRPWGVCVLTPGICADAQISCGLGGGDGGPTACSPVATTCQVPPAEAGSGTGERPMSGAPAGCWVRGPHRPRSLPRPACPARGLVPRLWPARPDTGCQGQSLEGGGWAGSGPSALPPAPGAVLGGLLGWGSRVPRGAANAPAAPAPAQPHFPSRPGRLPWQRGHNCSPYFPQSPAEGRLASRPGAQCWPRPRRILGLLGTQCESMRQTLCDPKRDPKRGSEGAHRDPNSYTQAGEGSRVGTRETGETGRPQCLERRGLEGDPGGRGTVRRTGPRGRRCASQASGL